MIKIITEYCRRHIKALGQTADQPSIQITATTGKAGCQIDGTTVHSAFILPCNVDLVPCSETISKLQKKYRHLKVLVIDEISMLEFHTLKNLNIQLQHIFDNKEPFGGVSLLFSEDLLQLPAIGYSVYETKFKKASYENLTRTLWHEHFKIYELTEIVRQSEDPDYGELLCRVREGKHTKNDLAKIESLKDTYTSNWPAGYLSVFRTNLMAMDHNQRQLRALNKEITTFHAKDSNKDIDTETVKLEVPQNTP